MSQNLINCVIDRYERVASISGGDQDDGRGLGYRGELGDTISIQDQLVQEEEMTILRI